MTVTGEKLLEIPYIQDAQVPAQTLDLVLPTRPRTDAPLPRLCIFIHGGAWRGGDKDEGHPLADALLRADEAHPGVATASINYRRSPLPDDIAQGKVEPSFHPNHVHDVHAALRYLLIDRPATWKTNDKEPEYDTNNVILTGHSCGAWLVAAVMLDPGPQNGSSIPAHAPLQPSTLRQHIHTYVLLDGIFDIDSLLDEYPSYAGFIGQAFDAPHGEPASVPTQGRYRPVNIQSWVLAGPYAKGAAAPRVAVVHSRDDDLLTLKQPELARQHLAVLISKSGASVSDFLVCDYDSIKGGHFDLLKTEAWYDYVRGLFKASP
ncbi:Glucan 1,3-beta-glucosidase 3 [Tilletia horrida]|uniref:Glucan 1,3-beta-glucosidase 3 n=1 Tax=Tilletia horrida TaxID=155126 RepID=A0AAN6GTM1_9BASI|nr:Glucan 1,3-beta-glucosidase 3 [Tilletia horrida]KAK0568638.1 Glucan 1,3-beta-glucosidase 3 [Tilletia horrida]